jgi:hypothetical protein
MAKKRVDPRIFESSDSGSQAVTEMSALYFSHAAQSSAASEKALRV